MWYVKISTTTEGKKDSPYINYLMFGNYQLCEGREEGPIVNPVEAVRENGILCLKDSEGYIITKNKI